MNGHARTLTLTKPFEGPNEGLGGPLAASSWSGRCSIGSGQP